MNCEHTSDMIEATKLQQMMLENNEVEKKCIVRAYIHLKKFLNSWLDSPIKPLLTSLYEKFEALESYMPEAFTNFDTIDFK